MVAQILSWRDILVRLEVPKRGRSLLRWFKLNTFPVALQLRIEGDGEKCWWRGWVG